VRPRSMLQNLVNFTILKAVKQHSRWWCSIATTILGTFKQRNT